MITEALALEGVDVLYGDSHVLHDVSFSFNAGRVLALLGRNGAGKTTCMSTIIGFLPPRDGEIRLFGEPIGRLAPETISRKGIGFVPQGRRIFPSLTVRENLIVAEMRRTIARLKEEGQSIVLVEQNIKLALDLADDVVMLNTGRVAFAGSVGEVLHNEALITQHLGVF